MKRYSFKYNIHDNKEVVEEDPDGEWVKYEDAKEVLDEAWWNARENEE